MGLNYRCNAFRRRLCQVRADELLSRRSRNVRNQRSRASENHMGYGAMRSADTLAAQDQLDMSSRRPKPPIQAVCRGLSHR